jgi:glycosyltransferase involved in cell wall biosynthesis
VSTKPLYDRLASRAVGQICLVENSLDGELWSLPSFVRASGKVPCHILYMGTPTHAKDFEIVKPALKKLAQRFKDEVKISVIGVQEEPLKEQWCAHLTPPTVAGGTYQGFVTWLQAINTFDIGIAPLVESVFSGAKSSIKWLDYSALGMATIASDVEPYSSAIVSGVDGLLVKNTADAWEKALTSLVEDKAQRASLAAAAKQRFSDSFLQEKQNEARIQLLGGLVAKS